MVNFLMYLAIFYLVSKHQVDRIQCQ